MNAQAVDLVIDRLVLAGVEMSPEQAGTLSGLLEQELRRILNGTRDLRPHDRSLAEALPVSFAQPEDLSVLARVLAERIAAEAGLAP